MSTEIQRIERDVTGLLVVDIQERLLPAMVHRERVVQNAVRLIRGAGILKVPVFATEQYRKGLGPTVPEIADAIPEFAPVEKMAFSACGAGGLVAQLWERKIRDAVLCGIEAHVCVTQTGLDLLNDGFRVFVVADAISSRTEDNWQWGIGRMRDAGAIIVSTEMVLFELLGEAGTEDFKQILGLVK